MEPLQSPADKQQEELQVLRSIFPAEDFLPPPSGYNAWKVKVIQRCQEFNDYAEWMKGTT